MYAQSYIKTAAAIIAGYTGSEPFSAHLRSYFAQHKKHGSRDRKAITRLCYSYFRTGRAFSSFSLEKRIILGLFLCSNGPEPILHALAPELGEQAALPAEEKIVLVGPSNWWNGIFPEPEQLSEQIDVTAFSLSHLQQPFLYLRIRPGEEKKVQQLIAEKNIPAVLIPPHTLQLPNSTDIAPLFTINKQVVVQDLSSQQTAGLFQQFVRPLAESAPHPIQVLDACAASGGKTILLYDVLEGRARFTVNDIRRTMKHNLEKRLAEAGIRQYQCFSEDMADAQNRLLQQKQYFDVVVADVPCSGSGTWIRTPEHLLFFNETQLQQYTALQQKILLNVQQLVKPGALLIYITCSVYACENEQQTAFLQQQYGLTLLHEQYFSGYRHNADTMYGAVLRK